MALKDWKKTENRKINFNFWNKKKNIGITAINKAFPERWEIKIYDNNPFNAKIIKIVDTKSQALKFAKQYMRKH